MSGTVPEGENPGGRRDGGTRGVLAGGTLTGVLRGEEAVAPKRETKGVGARRGVVAGGATATEPMLRLARAPLVDFFEDVAADLLGVKEGAADGPFIIGAFPTIDVSFFETVPAVVPMLLVLLTRLRVLLQMEERDT